MLYFRQMNKSLKTTVLYTDATRIASPEVLDEALKMLNSERVTMTLGINTDEDKALSVAAGMLGNILLETNGIQSEILHDSDGKPYIKGHPELYISFTHCWPYAAAMISVFPCGLDIESRSADLELIRKRYYSDAEKEYASSKEKTTDIWCRKESYIKYSHPQDVRDIDTFTIPEDYCYISVPLDCYSFEILTKKEDHIIEMIDLLSYISSQ